MRLILLPTAWEKYPGPSLRTLRVIMDGLLTPLYCSIFFMHVFRMSLEIGTLLGKVDVSRPNTLKQQFSFSIFTRNESLIVVSFLHAIGVPMLRPRWSEESSNVLTSATGFSVPEDPRLVSSIAQQKK